MSKQPKKVLPPQHQTQRPGLEYLMDPRPVFDRPKRERKLAGKTAIITGGDSGIGRAVSVLFAKEGANIVIVYLNEHRDAEETKGYVEKEGVGCKLIAGDIGDEAFATILCARQRKHSQRSIYSSIMRLNSIRKRESKNYKPSADPNVSDEYFFNVLFDKSCAAAFEKGSSIINTTSITAYAGNERLIDYSSTKGAITSFTRSLALSLVDQGIRVNGVAPGPIWTPLIPSTFTEREVEIFGSTTPMERPGQPAEVAPSYLFLASDDSSYMTGQVLHVNGGTIING